MARAKNTSRAEARRRARAEARAEFESTRQLSATDDTASEAPAAEPSATERRPSAFRLPNFRLDFRDLPSILTSRRAMAVPPLILLIGFLLQLGVDAGAIPTRHGVPMPLADNGWMSFADLASLYIQMFFLPPSLLTYFLAGYLAPRASWLVGLLLGLLSSVLWTVILLANPLAAEALLVGEGGDLVAVMGYFFLINLGYGTFAAAFAAWYRDFLRRMRDQGIARRAERESRERAKRREQRQEERRSVKSR